MRLYIHTYMFHVLRYICMLICICVYTLFAIGACHPETHKIYMYTYHSLSGYIYIYIYIYTYI